MTNTPLDWELALYLSELSLSRFSSDGDVGVDDFSTSLFRIQARDTRANLNY